MDLYRPGIFKTKEASSEGELYREVAYRGISDPIGRSHLATG